MICKLNLKIKINELQEIINQKQNEITEIDKQKKLIKGDNQKLNDQIKALSKQINEKDIRIHQISEQVESHSKFMHKKLKILVMKINN